MTDMHRLDQSPYRVAPGKPIRLRDFEPSFTDGFKDKAEAQETLQDDVASLSALQNVLWASQQYSVIIIFQALDAAGKDSTVKHVMSGVNPQGVRVHSFKAPTEEERLHHFLWRPARVAPARGEIAIFNRSYYEEVLVVRVHPEFLIPQGIAVPGDERDLKQIWKTRYADINAFEEGFVRNQGQIIKFFLNVSREEQKRRFLDRLQDPEKYWKFSAADLRESAHWNEYQQAYEDMLNATSTEGAPWYVIPADSKWFTRACVADIIVGRLEELKLKFPSVNESDRAVLDEARQALGKELKQKVK